MKDLQQLAPPEKRVAAKVLTEEGYSSRQIEGLIGMGHHTAWRASKEQTPEELTQFATEFKEALQGMKDKGLAEVHKRMLTLIPKYPRLDHLVKAAEYFEGKKDNLNIQVNIAPILGGVTKNVPNNNSNEEVAKAE